MPDNAMLNKAKWALAILGLWLGILLLQGAGFPPLLFNGLAYAVLAATCLAAVYRVFKLHPALGRITTLLVCSTLAGVDTGLSGLSGEAAQKHFFAALLGIALTAVLARHTPVALRRRWLGD